MLLKKSALLALALASAPFIAHAELVTHNNDQVKYSTVLLDNGRCAAQGIFGIGGKYTNPHSTSNVSDFEVRTICGKKGDCGATILMSSDLNQILACEGDKVEKIGHAVLDYGSVKVKELKNFDESKYTLSGLGGNELSITPVASHG